MSAPGRRWQAVLIVALVAVAVVGAAFSGWWYARESPPHQGPIVLISVDNLGAAALSPYGASGSDTPAIEALAADGVVFDRAFAHSPQTLPSHASILSGQLPFEHGVRDDAGFALKDEARTLAELLRNRGFETGAAVSTFLLRRESGIAQGFGFFDADLPEAGTTSASVVARNASLTIDAAERWMRTQDGQRFLLFVQVDGSEADATVSRLVRELRDLNLYDGATIVLVGDHGDTPPPSLADTALRVPLIIKQPGRQGAGRRVVMPVQHIDLLPTILDLVRAPVPSGIQGRSLRAVLDDEEAVLAEQPVYAESLAAHFRLGGQALYGVTSGALRYVGGGREGLFDLQAGGGSLPLDSPDAARLRGVLEGLVNQRPTDRPTAIPAADEDAYAALGYLPAPRLPHAAPIAIERNAETALIALHRSAALLVGQRRLGAAIDRLRTIVRAQPAVAIVHYQIGWLLLRTARYQEAAVAFAEAARLQPDDAGIAVALTAAELQARAYEPAQRHADIAVALTDAHDPDARAAAHAMAARVALATMDAESATRHAIAARDADASLPMPQFVRGRLLYDEGRYEDALLPLEEAQEAVRQSGRPLEELHATLGDTLARLDRDEDAEAQFREELRAFPRSTRSYASLAMLYSASNRDGDVDDVIGDLLEAAPSPEGYAIAARLWTILGERSRADAVRADARVRFRGEPAAALRDRER